MWAKSPQCAVYNVIEVIPEGHWVDRRQVSPSGEENVCREFRRDERAKLRDAAPIARDGYSLATRDAIEDITPVVAQVANRYLGHIVKCITRETAVVQSNPLGKHSMAYCEGSTYTTSGIQSPPEGLAESRVSTSWSGKSCIAVSQTTIPRWPGAPGTKQWKTRVSAGSSRPGTD